METVIAICLVMHETSSSVVVAYVGEDSAQAVMALATKREEAQVHWPKSKVSGLIEVWEEGVRKSMWKKKDDPISPSRISLKPIEGEEH